MSEEGEGSLGAGRGQVDPASTNMHQDLTFFELPFCSLDLHQVQGDTVVTKRPTERQGESFFLTSLILPDLLHLISLPIGSAVSLPLMKIGLGC